MGGALPAVATSGRCVRAGAVLGAVASVPGVYSFSKENVSATQVDAVSESALGMIQAGRAV